MLSQYKELQNKSEIIQIANSKLTSVVRKYVFLFISETDKIDFHQNIIQNIKDSKVIMIDRINMTKKMTNNLYFVVGFKNSIIIITKLLITHFFEQIYTHNNQIEIFFLTNKNDIFDQKYDFKYKESEKHENFEEEIFNFDQQFTLTSKFSNLKEIWGKINKCISGYLIKESYYKTLEDRTKNFYLDGNQSTIARNINNDDYVCLRYIGNGTLTKVELVYHIEDEKLYVIKKDNTSDREIPKLKEREKQNYMHIRHPLIPKFIGTTKESNDLVIEYINGTTLDNIKILHLNEEDKINIIIELILIFEYLQSKNFVYRDLKPNNVIIDENKTVVLIDYDRMIKYSTSNNENDIKNEIYTADLASNFLAPEVNLGQYSDKNDIYSLGMMIYYIIHEDFPKEIKTNKNLKGKTKFDDLIEKCIKQTPSERPSILELGFNFVINSFSQIQIENLYEIYEKYFSEISNLKLLNVIKYILKNKNTSDCLYRIANLFENSKSLKHDLKKAVHYYTLAANLNNIEAQYAIGLIYHEGKYVQHDNKKAIHYLTLAAEQNDKKSLFMLAIVLLNGENIQKAIEYLTIASDLNHATSQTYLGIIYEGGLLGYRDMNKAIHYYTLAADQNFSEAQYLLGQIYFTANYVPRDMNKCIQYFTAAADKNYLDAQFMLGGIYLYGLHIPKDINKAIHYLTMASKQNHLDSHFALGAIYYDMPGITVDVNKAIHFFSLAAKQNHAESLYYLGVIYSKGQYISKDIEKAINYFELAAKQNNVYALFELGLIYNNDEYNQYDIEKSIHYYTLAANKNHKESQYNLGVIYFNINDIKKAIFYFTFAAYQNYDQAEFALGYIYLTGKYVPRDIDKAIYFLTLAANQNHSKALYTLGAIYQNGQYVLQNIKKAIYYYSMAANQNNIEAFYNLGIIYYNGLSISRDIKKAIQYFTYAANHNHLESMFSLGIIYNICEDAPRDIKKAIELYTKAANQNHLGAQCNLAFIYEKGQYVTRDVNKAIHYYTLAAKQNQPEAQCNLAEIYLNGKYIKQDVKKAIHLWTMAANQNNMYAQFNLGLLYETGKGVEVCIEKAINYYLLSAYQKYSEAQFALGRIYILGIHVPQDVKKATHFLQLAANQNHSFAQLYLGFFNCFGINEDEAIKNGVNWLIQASKNGNIYAHFYVGYLYHEGTSLIERDIKKAIKFYKEGSSFNDQFAKNNLGIIYKNGFENEIQKNVQLSIEYFKEAIEKDNDLLSMYNLANIYFYDVSFKDDEKSIDLLLKSFNRKFVPSQILLCVVLINNYGFDIENIERKLNDNFNTPKILIKAICEMISSKKINNELIFSHLYSYYQQIDFLYNFYYSIIQTKDIKKKKVKKKIPEINSDFYEGFGLNLL